MNYANLAAGILGLVALYLILLGTVIYGFSDENTFTQDENDDSTTN